VITRRTVIVGAFFSAMSLVFADPPAEVMQVFGDAAGALANGDIPTFLNLFDRNMSGYADLRERVEGLVAAYEVSSTVEVIADEGDDKKRALQLDWLLSLNDRSDLNARKETRRNVVKCTVQRQGRGWKITSFEPLDLFRY